MFSSEVKNANGYLKQAPNDRMQWMYSPEHTWIAIHVATFTFVSKIFIFVTNLSLPYSFNLLSRVRFTYF